MLNTLFLIAAVVGGTVLVCQFVLTLLGMGGDETDAGYGDGEFTGDLDVDGDRPPSFAAAADAEYQHTDSSWLFGVLSFRTLVAAAAFFGVAGMAASSAGMSQAMSLTTATAAGLAAMYGMYWLLRLISQLTSSGNERIGNAVGQRATVYVPIPAARGGAGKVQMSMQNRIVEYQAVTDDRQPLKTGEAVDVVGVAGSDVVQVRRVAASVSA